ncbi:MAG: ABC transporter ATP-binding protein [Planctomycetes bacterium]|nr:ABC transporter ATP-binding protein [Planctomycetota bacterium]
MLRLTDLRKSFGSVRAVDGLSLEIRTGEVFGLLGPNGAGKSTTISMAMGLLRPDSGTVELVGAGSPMDPEVRRKLGLAPQAIALYGNLSANENLLFFARLYGLADAKSRVAEVLELVGLSARAKDHVSGYSGGMQRRLNLAVALLHKPPLLLLDEPTAGVDPQSRNSILDLVRTLAKGGCTIVYTTHYMEEAQKLCDRVGVIDNGKLLDVGTVAELVSRHGGDSAVVVERSNGNGEAAEERVLTKDPLREISSALARGDVSGVRVERPTLESVFLSLTGRSLRD